MKRITLGIHSSDGLEASIRCEGSQGGSEDFFAVVTIKGFVSDKRVYGVDPIQAFALGWRLIEDLTRDKRLSGEEGQSIDGASWSIRIEPAL